MCVCVCVCVDKPKYAVKHLHGFARKTVYTEWFYRVAVPHVTQFAAIQVLGLYLQHRAADFLVTGHSPVVRVFAVPFATFRVHERGHVVVDVDHLDIQLQRKRT